MLVSGSRRRSLVALVIGGVLVASPAASAATSVKIGGSASPAITGFPTTPRPLNLTVDTRFSSDVPGALPDTIAKATVFFSHGPRVNGALFPSCDPRTLARLHGLKRACPAGSRLGGGTATGGSEQFPGVTEKLTVDVYNAAHGRTLLFYLRGQNPVQIEGLVKASLRKLRSHRWAYKLTLPVPENLQEISRGIFASLETFKVTVGRTTRVHGVKRGYIEVFACPPGALVPVRGLFDFRGGDRATSDGYVTCR